MAIAFLLGTVAIVLITLSSVALMGWRTGRQHERALPEWWIPLFLRASITGAIGAVGALLLFEYGEWKVRDTYAEQAVRRGTVARVERQRDRTVYEFDTASSGGLGRFNRYDFRVQWEYLAAAGAISGVVTGALALFVARIVIRTKSARPAFAVLLRDEPSDHGIGKSA